MDKSLERASSSHSTFVELTILHLTVGENEIEIDYMSVNKKRILVPYALEVDK